MNVAINSEAVDPHPSRRLVLPARHARLLLPGRELHLQHPHGPLAQGDRPLSRQHGHRHDRRRRQVVCRIARAPRRARALRAARSRRGRAEIFAALRSRSRSRRRQRARHPAAALARRLARRRRQSRRGHLRHRIRAHRHRARARGAGLSGRWIPARRGGPPGSGIVPAQRSTAEWSTAERSAAGRPARRAAARPAHRRSGTRAGRRELARARPTCASRPPCCRLSRNGRSRRSPNAGGYPGAPYFRITIAGTERSLTATAGGELTATAVHRRAGATVAHRPAHRRQLSHQSRSRSRASTRDVGAVRRRQQHADACRSSIPPAIASAGCWEHRDENRPRHPRVVYVAGLARRSVAHAQQRSRDARAAAPR